MKKGILRNKDVLIVKDGATTGKVGIYKNEFKNAAINEHVFILRANENLVPEYLYYVLRSDEFQSALKNKIQGIIQGINLKFAELLIPLPPLDKQQEIVDEIEQYQKVIDGARQVVENYEPSLILNSDWESLEIEDIGEVISGGTPKTTEETFWGGDVNWVTLKDFGEINNIKFIDNSERKITDIGLKKSSAKLIPVNSVIVSTRATIGKVAINSIELSTNQGCKSIVIDDKKYNPIFIAVQLLNKRKELQDLATGGTFKEISTTNYKKIKLLIPNIDTQNKIAENIVNELKVIDSNLELIDSMKNKISEIIINLYN